MWQRKELKNGGKLNIKKNYWHVIAVCFLMALLAFEYVMSTQLISEYRVTNEYEGEVIHVELGTKNTSSEKLTDLIQHATGNVIKDTPTKGVLASLYNSALKGKDAALNFVSALDKFIFSHEVLEGILTLLGVMLSLFYLIFIRNLLRVGERRFFLESRTYHGTKIGRFGFVYRTGKIRNVAWVMMFRSIFSTLWWLTIVGGPIKAYEYKMIPYLLAENPGMDRKSAFALSKQMMMGNKWRAFVLDLSFIWWELLAILTLGILAIFFTNPYRRATEAELYMYIRSEEIQQKMPMHELLNDAALQADAEDAQKLLYPGLDKPKKHHLNLDYNRHYTIVNLILLFFAFSVIGWLWEVSLHIVKDGVFVNRGTLFGPWLPIYGTGGISVLILLKRLANKPVVFFLVTMVVCGIIEYASSWYLEETKGAKWWDYSGYLLNINGRICLEGLLVFAIAGCAAVYIIAPILDGWLNKISNKKRYVICAVLVAGFCTDVVYSHFHPNTGKGITDYGSIQTYREQSAYTAENLDSIKYRNNS